ncbi:hypothetical protein BC332_20356 [Capsicum chinense]|nr:hypothetical protein BC332_20356 [Capsicum chinense]
MESLLFSMYQDALVQQSGTFSAIVTSLRLDCAGPAPEVRPQYCFASTDEEATGLVKWKATFHNENNSLLASWTLSTDACRDDWYGIICINGRINRLNIANVGVTGTLYDFPFSSLPFLEYVDLSMNQLFGPIPPELGKMKSLEIGGSIPPEIGNVKGLLGLDLSSNHLIGQIPKEFGKLTSLIRLLVQNNSISGNIPGEFVSLAKLESLDLSDNRLNGMIPTCIGDFVHLFQLDLSNNKFGENIPIEIGKMTQLNVLDLSHNLLVGDIPPQLANLKVLVDLNLSHNCLSGHIPEEVESMTGLQVVFLSYNELEGPIPNNKAFITASLQGNKGLCGNLTGFQPCERPSKHSIVKR